MGKQKSEDGGQKSGVRFSDLTLKQNLKLVLAITTCVTAMGSDAVAFDGKIDIVITRGSETTPLLYTVGENFLRVEVIGSDRPNPIDIVDLKSGVLTLLFPHNRSFVRLKSGAANTSAQPPGAPAFPRPPPGMAPLSHPNPAAAGPPGAPAIPTPPGGLPPGIGPQPQGVTGAAVPQMPPMPMMPPMMSEKIELKPTGKKEKVLGFACEQFEIKTRGETMEIWATDQFMPFFYYVQSQPSRLGPRMIAEQWPELLKEKKLFPLRAILRLEGGGGERLRFEVKSITPEKIDDKDGKLFQPPKGYFEVQPLPY